MQLPNLNARTEKFRKSLIPDCIRKWNELSPNTRNIVSHQDFVKEISLEFNPNKLYNGISRKASIIHSQFRLKCSNLKSDLFGLHVIEDPFCICSNQVENCNHFFFHCHLHTLPRARLFDQLRLECNVEITTDLLLYGSDFLSKDCNKKIFALVEEYILQTGRF